jgi:hypothetical protein
VNGQFYTAVREKSQGSAYDACSDDIDLTILRISDRFLWTKLYETTHLCDVRC